MQQENVNLLQNGFTKENGIAQPEPRSQPYADVVKLHDIHIRCRKAFL